MSKYLPLLATILVTLAGAFSSYGQAAISAHPGVAAVLVILASALHAALPSIFASPAGK